MGVDIFGKVDQTQFWAIFGTASAVTYILAAIGLLAIYRKGFWDWLRSGTQILARDHESPRRLRKPSRFLEREKKQRLKDTLGSMQKARTGRKPTRRSTFQNVITGIKTDENVTAWERPSKNQRESKATVLSQPLWLPEEGESYAEAERFRPSGSSSSPNLSSPSPQLQRTQFSQVDTPRQDRMSSIKFTMDIPSQLRNLGK